MILPKGLPFLLSSRPAVSGMNADRIYAPIPHGGTAVYGGGGDFFMTGSRFLLSGRIADVLLSVLPSVVIVKPGPQQETVRWSINRIVEELRNSGPARPCRSPIFRIFCCCRFSAAISKMRLLK